jgi:nicotinate phosphoribosyltransferase
MSWSASGSIPASIEARKMLDKAGFPNASIVASNDLDEHIIDSLYDQGATIGVWGVGTKLITGYDQPALGGVYKLTAVRKPGEKWQYKVKLSEQAVKISTPGLQQVRRFYDREGSIADAIFDELNCPDGQFVIVDPLDMTRRRVIRKKTAHVDLLKPLFRKGKEVYTLPPLKETKAHVKEQLGSFHAGIKRLLHPHQYPVGLEQKLHDLKTELVLHARGFV